MVYPDEWRAQQAAVPPQQDHAGDLRPGEAHWTSQESNQVGNEK